MGNENKQSCDTDDIICQLEVLRHLKGLEEQLGNEKFLEKYPEGKTLKERLPAEITQQQQVVDSGIAECGKPEEEERVAAVAAEEPRPDQELAEDRPE